MHGPKKRAGGVCAIEGVKTPASVAKEVANQTDHHLLAGKGAQDFARGLGFPIEADLNTETSRRFLARGSAVPILGTTSRIRKTARHSRRKCGARWSRRD